MQSKPSGVQILDSETMILLFRSHFHFNFFSKSRNQVERCFWMWNIWNLEVMTFAMMQLNWNKNSTKIKNTISWTLSFFSSPDIETCNDINYFVHNCMLPLKWFKFETKMNLSKMKMVKVIWFGHSSIVRMFHFIFMRNFRKLTVASRIICNHM